MKNVRTFGQFVNEGVINEMADRRDYKPTKRKSADLEKELSELIDKHKNQDKYENEEKERFRDQYQKELTPLVNKIVPKGCSVNRKAGLPIGDYIPITLDKNNEEVCSIYAPVGAWKVDSFDALTKNAYINYSSSWCYLDSDTVLKLEALGEIVKSIGSAKNPWWKEYYDLGNAINKEHKEKMSEIRAEDSKYGLSNKVNELRIEFINAKFQEVLKPGLSFDLEEGFTVNADRRGRFGQEVKKIIIKKIKPKNCDLIYVYDYRGYGEAEEIRQNATWKISTVFEAWTEYSKEGKAANQKYEKLSSW